MFFLFEPLAEAWLTGDDRKQNWKKKLDSELNFIVNFPFVDVLSVKRLVQLATDGKFNLKAP